MIHHVQRKRIHNAAAINKGMKHWSKVLFIWRLHAADVCSSLPPPPPLFLSFLTTFSETGHITTARYAVKDVLKSRCCGFTVHNAGLKARFALYVSNRGMWVCLCYWTWPRRCRFRVQRGFFFESQEVSTALPERASTPNPQGLLSQYLRNPWPLAKQGGSLFLSLKLSFSLQFTLFRSGGFRVQVHCQARPGHVEGRPAVGLKQKHRVDLLFLSVCVMQSCVIWLKVV